MLQSFRDNLKGTAAIILVCIISIPFVLAGVESLFNTNSSQAVAEVNGVEISKFELDRSIMTQRQQMTERFGDSLPVDFLSEERLAGPVLDQLIERQALLSRSEDFGMAVSVAEVDKIILQTEQFKVDGAFNADIYQQAIRGGGFTNQSYKSLLSEETILSQLSIGVSTTNFSLGREIELLSNLGLQTRSFDYLTVSYSDFKDTVEVNEEKLGQYYQDNQDEFIDPEAVIIEVLELDAAMLANDITVDDEDVKASYERQVQELESKTRRYASHILFDTSTDDHEQRLTEVQEKLAAGEDFAELAKNYSDDFGSRDNGGDVGFTTGSSFVPEFEAALMEMEVGQISEPVKTQFGFHIINLTALDIEPVPTLDEMRMEIVQELKSGQAESLYVEKLTEFEDATYNAESLADAAEELGLTVWNSERITRQSATGLAANPSIRSTAFDAELIESGLASNVLELSSDRSAVVRVVEHFPETVKPLESVLAEVESSYRDQQARELLQTKLDEAKASLGEEGSLADIANEYGVELKQEEAAKRNQAGVARELIQAVFAAPKPADATVYDSVELRSGEIALFGLGTVVETKESISAQEKSAVENQLLQQLGVADYDNFRTEILDTSDVKRFNEGES